MRKVNFKINRREYQLMIDSDQAAQLQQIAAEVDSRANKIASANPSADDMNVLMMTCLTLADELYEARQEAGELHEKFMLAQPELQNLLPLSHFSKSEAYINELMDGMEHLLEQVIRPNQD